MSWEIIGQARALAVLRRAVEDEGRLSHAYLFVGPEHVGKATVARRFAQALNCVSEGERPCGECRSCRLIAEDKHPDVEWLRVGGLCDESEHKDHESSRDIRICQVRRLERVVSRTAFEARYRVIVVDPADALTTEAANAFLKTLEEPPSQVVLVLVTAREEALLETVRSRCRRVAFDGVPREAIASALRERWGAEPAQAERLARLSGGRLGWAVAALTDEKLLEEREEVVEDIESLLAGGYSERFAYAAELAGRYSRNPDAVRATLELWRDWWRDVLLVAAGKHELVADPQRLDTLRSYAAQYGVQGALQALAAVSEGREHLEERANPTLALEAMLLELPAAAPTGA
ncbi:MAG: DNA polymerase III subunit delta' [Dehalococcoidia bacterium]